ncbi:ABC transporter substrate-binding protein [Hanstruepera marina]|uniref:ABC transporter substrate-binding protein n=1 Tax=Hanstruepera marina TaxID=2873265 RepID=UPI001CA5F92F|nr:helical backbone metal receptor [Hanstruepera marina]
MKINDQLNRTLVFSEPPTRIVSLVPSLTELVCDLGLKTFLVGVTKFCVHPEDIRYKAVVAGGTKQVHYDKIRELNPDVILCNKEENTQDMIRELEKIAPVHISDINTIQDCLDVIEVYGIMLGVEKQAELIVSKIKDEQSNFELFIKTKPIRTVVYFIWKDPWMAVGKNTFINYMLTLNRFDNYFGSQSRYPEVNMKEIYSEVDMVLLSTEPFPFNKEHFKFIQPRFPNAKILLVDGEMFSWYGSRMVKAFKYFKELHGDY